MSADRFYCPRIQSGLVTLDAAESRHVAGSRRLRVGDAIVLFDGQGHEGHGTIVELRRQDVQVKIDRVEERPFDGIVTLTIATALPKASRQSFLVEKCVELGVAAIWPMICEHSVVRGGAETESKWRRTAIEAAKQCGTCWLPDIAPPRPFDEILALLSGFRASYLADVPEAESERFSGGKGENEANVLVLVGPEGGWTDAERQRAFDAGVRPLRLARRTLRIETACFAAAAHFAHV